MWRTQTQLQGSELIEVNTRIYDDDPEIQTSRGENKNRSKSLYSLKSPEKMNEAKFNELIWGLTLRRRSCNCEAEKEIMET